MARVPASKRTSPFTLSRSSACKAKEFRFMRCRSLSFLCPFSTVSVMVYPFLGSVPLGFGALQLEPQTRPRGVGAEVTALGAKHPVEEQVLDAHVVVEEFEVHQCLHRAASVGRDRGRAMCREGDRATLADAVDP